MNRITLNILIVVLLVLVMGLVVFVSGCNQPNSNSELQRLRQPVSQFAQQWIEKYGEGAESVKNYNLVLTQQILTKQAQDTTGLNKTLEARIKTLEDKVVELENE